MNVGKCSCSSLRHLPEPSKCYTNPIFPFLSTLFDIWGAMASGSPIDEQRAYWLTTSAAGLAAVAVLDDTPVPDYYGGGEDGEDDRDPNDVAAMQAQAMAAQEAVGARGGTDPYANLEDDDDDDW